MCQFIFRKYVPNMLHLKIDFSSLKYPNKFLKRFWDLFEPKSVVIQTSRSLKNALEFESNKNQKVSIKLSY